MTDAEGNEIGKLFVGGLSQATNNGSLRMYFSRFGDVDDAIVMMDNKTGRSRGFGYVKYREEESVSLALEAKPHILDSKEVDAKQCNVNMKGRNRRSLKIFVGGIGLDQDSESIKNYFRQFGHVTDVNLMMDSNKQRHRGFAFVGFEDETVVKRLIGMHYVTMNNKQVEIKAMEPPNFVRKISPGTCVTAAVITNGAAGDGDCTHVFDHNTDPAGLLTGRVATAYGPTYLPSQTSGMSCTQHSIISETRPSPSNGYDQSGGFSAALVADGLFQPTAFIHSIPQAQYTTRNPSESILPSVSNSTGSYIASKPAVSLFLTDGQLHSTNSTPLMSNSLNPFNPGNSSVYATIPCQLIPPHFVQHSHASGVASMMNAEKSASLGAWSTGTTHLTLCPSTHMVSQAGLMTCSPFSPNHTTLPSGSAMSSPGHANGPSSNSAGSVLTPYYAVCPQYTIQLPMESLGSTIPGSTSGLNHPGSSSTPCIFPNAPHGERDGTILQLTAQLQAASSHNQEAKPESANATNTHKLIYPTILMGPPNGLTGSSMVTPAAPGMNMGSTLWNPNTSNLVYPPVPVGWTVHTGSQPTNTSNNQAWPSTPVAMVSQNPQISVVNFPGTVKLNCLSSESPSIYKDCSVNSNLTAATNSAKASGDTVEGLMSNEEFTLNSDHGGTYRNVKSSNATNHTDRIGDVQSRPNGQSTVDVANWQPGNSPTSERNTTTINVKVPPPNWHSNPTGSDSNSSMTPWPECTQIPLNFPGPTNVIVPLQPWTSPLEMLEDANAAYELAMNTHAANSRIASVAMGTNVTNGSMRRVSNGTGTNKRSILINGATPAPIHTNTSNEVNTGDTQTQSLLSNPYTDITSANQPTRQPSPKVNTGDNRASSNSPRTRKTDPLALCKTSPTGVCTELQNNVNHTPHGNTNPRLEYAAWLYQTANGTVNGHFDNGGDSKELSVGSGVEIECQGPAGAAGDFHHTVVHTTSTPSHLALYPHLTR